MDSDIGYLGLAWVVGFVVVGWAVVVGRAYFVGWGVFVVFLLGWV